MIDKKDLQQRINRVHNMYVESVRDQGEEYLIEYEKLQNVHENLYGRKHNTQPTRQTYKTRT